MDDERYPLSGREYTALQYLFVAASTFIEMIPALMKRAKRVPGLWRDLRLLQVVAEKCLDRLLGTIPVKKLLHVKEDIKHTSIYIRVEAPGIKSMDDKSFSYVPTAALNSVLDHLCNTECMWCDKGPDEAKTCPYRRMIEDCLPHTVGRDEETEHCKYSSMSLGLEVANG